MTFQCGGGSNTYGQLGNGTYSNTNSWIHLMDNVKSVSSSSGHTLALKMDGTLWGTGANQNGSLGLGSIPMTNQWFIIFSNVNYMDTGVGYSVVIKNDGTVWGTGFNRFNQFGQSTTNDLLNWQQIIIP